MCFFVCTNACPLTTRSETNYYFPRLKNLLKVVFYSLEFYDVTWNQHQFNEEFWSGYFSDHYFDLNLLFIHCSYSNNLTKTSRDLNPHSLDRGRVNHDILPAFIVL